MSNLLFVLLGVLMLDGDTEVREANLTNWLKKKLGVSTDLGCDLTDLLPPIENDKHFPGEIKEEKNNSSDCDNHVHLIRRPQCC